MGRAGGFSQIELTVTLALAALLGGISLPRAMIWGEIARVHGAANSLAVQLRQVRARAIRDGETLTVRFDAGAMLWETRTAGGAVLDATHLPTGVGFGSLPQSRQLHFGGTGKADNGTVVLTSPASTARVVVNQRGRVRIG